MTAARPPSNLCSAGALISAVTTTITAATTVGCCMELYNFFCDIFLRRPFPSQSSVFTSRTGSDKNFGLWLFSFSGINHDRMSRHIFLLLKEEGVNFFYRGWEREEKKKKRVWMVNRDHVGLVSGSESRPRLTHTLLSRLLTIAWPLENNKYSLCFCCFCSSTGGEIIYRRRRRERAQPVRALSAFSDTILP